MRIAAHNALVLLVFIAGVSLLLMHQMLTRRAVGDPFNLFLFNAEQEVKTIKVSSAGNRTKTLLEEPTLIGDNGNDLTCRPHALVYLVQKNHSSYNTNRVSVFQKSLDLVYENYLAQHHEDVSVYLFHTGDYDAQNVQELEKQYPNLLFRLVDLSNTEYWEIPSWLRNDDQSTWADERFSIGYRHMIRWFAIKIWDFFAAQPCNIDYIMRLDEDSFIYSPIKYNIFEFMKEHDYNYGYRQCAYVMYEVEKPWKKYLAERKSRDSSFEPMRNWEVDLCGFYNNFFIAKLDFFRSDNVQDFLSSVDKSGTIYRDRTGDLGLHTLSVYAFSPPEKIHRFLDFTYEHFTMVSPPNGCPAIGGIQQGYNDPQGRTLVMKKHRIYRKQLNCGAVNTKRNLFTLTWIDLSPTYNHIPKDKVKSLVLTCLTAYKHIDEKNRTYLSG